MRVNIERGPKQVLLIQTANTDEDVTHLILPYLGPHGNCNHYTYITPQDIGLGDLIVNKADGTDDFLGKTTPFREVL